MAHPGRHAVAPGLLPSRNVEEGAALDDLRLRFRITHAVPALDEERRLHAYQKPETLETVLHLTMTYAGNWVEDTPPN